MRVFENMTLRTIFGHRREEAEGQWSKLRNGSSLIAHLSKHSYGHSVQQGSVRGSGGTHAEEKCIKDFGGEACRKETTWKPQT